MEPWATQLSTAASCAHVKADSVDAVNAALDSAAPAVIDGLLSAAQIESLGLRHIFGLTHTSAPVRVQLNPYATAPQKRRGLIVRPASTSVNSDRAIEILLDANRTAYASIATLSVVERCNELLSAPPLWPVVELALNGALQDVCLWVNPRHRGMRTALHYDGFDNLLVQVRGSKRLLLLPPEARGLLRFEPRGEHAYVLDTSKRRPAFDGHAPRGDARMGSDGRWVSTVALDNHAGVNVFAEDVQTATAEEREEEDEVSVDDALGLELAPHAIACTLNPGQVAFIPALWSHAAVSFTDGDDDEGRHAEERHLNVAINLWFYSNRSTASFERAIQTSSWPHAELLYARALRALGRRREARRLLEGLLASTAGRQWGGYEHARQELEAMRSSLHGELDRDEL